MLHVCYEAGPCGYGVQRQLTRLGHRCDVVAPALIPRKVGDKVKTDRRDAMMLAQTLRAGQLTTVWTFNLDRRPKLLRILDYLAGRDDIPEGDRVKGGSKLTLDLHRLSQLSGQRLLSSGVVPFWIGLDAREPGLRRAYEVYSEPTELPGRTLTGDEHP